MQSEGNAIRNIVIVGGGTAGWMSAAVLSRWFPREYCEIHLVESSAIPTVGVGEATIPSILKINQMLGIDEPELIRRTKGTYKLGIEFDGWAKSGERYFHPFGSYGRIVGPIAFPHYWRRFRSAVGGRRAGNLEEYSLNAVAAAARKFDHKSPSPSGQRGFTSYALHFDATLYAAYLAEIAERRGVTRHDSKVVGHRMEDGSVASIALENGSKLHGDLFIDCTGFRALLIGGAMDVGFIDWSRFLPCDRAVVVQSEPLPDLPPFTRAKAGTAGWQWRIPLQDRTSNGYVYCSSYIDEEAAQTELMANLSTKATASPRLIRFRTGRRNTAWKRNVVAIGLSAGFIEPLESTSIHLLQTGLERLLNLMPTKDFRQADIDFYNRSVASEFERVRDFIVLHYHTNARTEKFWQDRRTEKIPETLRERIDLYRGYGRTFKSDDDLFGPVSWTAVMEGQGLHGETHDPFTDCIPGDSLANGLDAIRSDIQRAVANMPSHKAYIEAMLKHAHPGSCES
ncbi:tryptophan halogenase family protein [Stakelama marina]|uniref:Tryptophan 7-halogenase n=1 Tax=Stakelama marina TaxID=2826939 RepID=A0A8T4IAW3_9SPHN|nr:tryptophan 7-halogenase [Stakelama marina]MBR0551543.1 tryptophan 7-halogenase [Stakelama marina]